MYDLYTDELLIGATFWAIGYAISTNNTTMIVESSIRPGREFIDCYKFGGEWDYICLTKAGDLFKSQLKRKNIISENHWPVLQAFVPVLCDVIVKNNLNVLLSSELICVNKTAEGYIAQICNASGITKIKTRKIIQTDAPEKFGKKSLNAVLFNKGGKQFSGDKFTVFASDHSDTAYIKMPVEKDDTLLVARQKLYSLLRSRPKELEGFTLISIGSVFEYYDFEQPGISLSAAYENPVQAFDMGAWAGNGGMAG